jgi:hypothetical protein
LFVEKFVEWTTFQCTQFECPNSRPHPEQELVIREILVFF